MPVILNRADYASWLNPGNRDTNVASGLLVPYAGSMRRYSVSTRINQLQNDDAERARPIELEPSAQGQLFG